MLSTCIDSMNFVFDRMRDINVTAIPVNPFDLISTNRWQLCTYKIFEKIIRMNSEEIKAEISLNAFSFYSFSDDTFFIIYNGEFSPEVIRFNLCHEIGHIAFGHVSPEKTTVDINENHKLEYDILADKFARFVLQIWD